jgi:hypothetical protein
VDFSTRKNKKSPVTWCAELFAKQNQLLIATGNPLSSQNADKLAAFGAFYLKNDFAIGGREQGVVFTATHVVARMKTRATLADDDIASQHAFATILFNA